ncbi:S1 family peptidase [Jatrophihabitans fulvus]
MKTKLLALAALAAATLTVGAGATAPAAQAAPAKPNIIGGSSASVPWEVQLIFEQGGGTYGCTGEQLNASWVLTALHCADGTTAMDVYQSNSTTNRGPAHAVDALYYAPSGDIALAHLASPASLSSYAPLNLSYGARSSGTGTVMGYGARANGAQSDGLYKASVSLTGGSTDAYGGNAQHVTGIDGASNHGDSGGALVVNGSVVGVCSTGDTADPGSNINAGSNYAILSQSGSWISSTAGV